MSKYEIIYHESATDNEWRDGARFDDYLDAIDWAKEHVNAGEYYFIDEIETVEELPKQNMQETVEEFFDYLDECSNGAGLKMMF